jgi:cold shock CspA family protein
MQATVYRFDPNTGSGAVLTDDGNVLAFDVAALRFSGLRHLRPGQRLTVELADPPDTGSSPETPARIAQLTLGTIGGALRAQRDRQGRRAGGSGAATSGRSQPRS